MSSGETLEAAVGEKEKKAAATNSVIAAVFLTGMKLVVGLATGSLGILAEAAHSALDLVAAVVTFLAVRFSDKPADREHPYGHGKIENFSALIETILLFATCAWIIYEAVQRLFFHTREVNASLWGFVVMAVSIAVDVSRSRMLYRAARKYNSQALEADALHFHTDIWSSSVVIGGLALVWLGQNVFPEAARVLARADAVAALGVAIIVLFVSYRLGKRTIDVLLDSAPDGMIREIGDAAGGVDGVMSVSQVRVRRSGPRVFVDLDRRGRPQPLFRADARHLRRRRSPHPGDLARRRRRHPHRPPGRGEGDRSPAASGPWPSGTRWPSTTSASTRTADSSTVDLHMEVDDHLSLQQAHEMASHIEQDLRADQPRIARINTHIESRGTGVGEGEDVTARGDAAGRDRPEDRRRDRRGPELSRGPRPPPGLEVRRRPPLHLRREAVHRPGPRDLVAHRGAAQEHGPGARPRPRPRGARRKVILLR